jgi:hypothetical protein
MHSRTWLPLLALTACTSSATIDGRVDAHVSGDGVDPSPADSSGDSYTVHEWGLLDATLGQSVAEVGAGPGRAPPARAVKKPVLYVHLGDGVDALAFTARVELPGGKMLEHWPPAELDGESALSWHVGARREHCGTVATGGCYTDDGVCEVLELPSYDAPSAACLKSGETSAGMLFYRGSIDLEDLPFAIERGAGDDLRVSARPTAQGAPGELWRITAGEDGYRISRAALPGAEATLLGPGQDPVDPAREDAGLASAMRDMGLTDDEAQAFVRAWSASLFGADASAAKDLPAKESAKKAPMRPPAAPLSDVVLYWLPAAAIDKLAPLTFTPPPAAVRRAMLVRVEIPPS